MKTIVTLFILTSGIICCDKANDNATTNTSTTSAMTTTSSTSQSPAVPATGATGADNTRLNARDDASALTAMDQGNDSADISTSASIRKALMADDSLSSDAKNIKVITNNGTITLRGPVKSDAEKNNIQAKATANAGMNRVVNQLDVELKK